MSVIVLLLTVNMKIIVLEWSIFVYQVVRKCVRNHVEHSKSFSLSNFSYTSIS